MTGKAAVTAAILLGAALMAGVANGKPSLIIQGDSALSSFSTWQHGGKLARAIAVFGEPAELVPGPGTPHPGTCLAKWPRLGMSIRFYWYEGLGSACVPENGCFFEALIIGGQWRTARGLAIGDPRAHLYALCPSLKLRSGGWRALLIRPGPADHPVDTLSVKLVGGHVVAFRVNGTPCGI